MMAAGRTNPDELVDDENAMSPLDKHIIELAQRKLDGSEKTVFFYAYYCQQTWDDISKLFLLHMGKKLKPSTARTYGERAKRTMKSAARSAPPVGPSGQ